jgi:ribonuclease VapC
MVLDTSAVIAILTSEPGSVQLADRVAAAESLSMSAATLVEAGIVMQARYGDAGVLQLDLFVDRTNTRVHAVTHAQADLAREAFRRFGKGRHPAALNFGDCFSYALAADLAEPLLFVGQDFAQTDISGDAD